MTKFDGLDKLQHMYDLLMSVPAEPHIYGEVPPDQVVRILHNLEDMMILWDAECLEDNHELSMHQPHWHDLLSYSNDILVVLQTTEQQRLLHQLPLVQFKLQLEDFGSIMLNVEKLPPR